MHSSNSILSHPIVRQIAYASIFGICAMLLGHVQFNLPGIIGVATDMREVPLLISLFYLKHPLYIFLECGYSILYVPENGSVAGAFLMHVIPLCVGWVFYHRVLKTLVSDGALVMAWVVFAFVYYLLLIIPLMIWINQYLGLTEEVNFWGNYQQIVPSILFEIFSTSLVTSIFLLQYRSQQDLVRHKNNLETDISEKTKALAETNHELLQMNANLDLLAKERANQLHAQFHRLLQYAHHNEYEVREPLKKINQLMEKVLLSSKMDKKMEWIEKLNAACNELDIQVIEMNRILETEILSKSQDVNPT